MPVERPRRLRRHAFNATRLDTRSRKDRLDLVDRHGELLPGLSREHRKGIVVDRRIVIVAVGQRIDQLVTVDALKNVIASRKFGCRSR